MRIFHHKLSVMATQRKTIKLTMPRLNNTTSKSVRLLAVLWDRQLSQLVEWRLGDTLVCGLVDWNGCFENWLGVW
jgi:hypothetical protein